jgi:biopolymer transport protein ExbB
MNSILTAFQEGGIFMYFILLFGILTASIIAERFYALYINIKLAPEGFRKQLFTHIARGDFKAAESYAQSFGNKFFLGKVVSEGCRLRGSNSGEDELQGRMDEKLAHEISKIDKRTAFLATFGNIATLLGLLGTIAGMIHSFGAVASASPADRATMLSKGISEAMNCTAFGLIVAIPALVAYAFFQNRTDQVVTELTENTTEIYHDLLFLTESTDASLENGSVVGSRASKARVQQAPALNA